MASMVQEAPVFPVSRPGTSTWTPDELFDLEITLIGIPGSLPAPRFAEHSMWHRNRANQLAGSLLCLSLGACVFEADDSALRLSADETGPNPTYSIGGTVTGAGGPNALQNSNGTNVIVATDGSFDFETQMVPSAIYNVTVAVHPTSQACMVANGAGTVRSADISNVIVTCTAKTYMSSSRTAGSEFP